MNATLYSLIALGIVLICTILGSLVVFFSNKEFNQKAKSILLSLASGIMVGAALFCLLRESIIESNELIESGLGSLISIGCTLVGFLIMLGFDKLIDKLGENKVKQKSSKLIFAILLHNIPEGLSLGIVCGELYVVNDMNPIVHTVISLAIVLAIHNLIQSITTSLVLVSFNTKKINAFLLMSLAGVVEVIFAILGILLTNSISNIVSILMAIAAGVMLFVGVIDLFIDSLKNKFTFLTIIFLLIGLIILYVLIPILLIVFMFANNGVIG